MESSIVLYKGETAYRFTLLQNYGTVFNESIKLLISVKIEIEI